MSVNTACIGQFQQCIPIGSCYETGHTYHKKLVIHSMLHGCQFESKSGWFEFGSWKDFQLGLGAMAVLPMHTVRESLIIASFGVFLHQ